MYKFGIVLLKSEKNKFIYSNINKCAGTTMKTCLKEVAEDIEELKFKNIEIACRKLNMGKYLKFNIVRNPWDRYVSLYEHAQRSNDSIYWNDFKNFIKKHEEMLKFQFYKKHSRSQWISILPGSHLIHIENLNKEWWYVANKIGLKDKLPLLPIKNKGKRKPYQEYYDDWCKEEIAKIYKKDIEILGYRFGD